jgi:pimeloyl-ACP methyl ester carboxylesterase
VNDHRTTTVRIPGLVLTEHEVDVPLDHSQPRGEQITAFAREVADPEGLDKPYLVFFQGGPGAEAPRPTRGPTSPTWLDVALRHFRVLMLDGRGTGRSAPVGSLPGLTPRQQADRLVHFRADSIVADAEHLRQHLGVDHWSVLGQSFGGFCVLRYLSSAPSSLRMALLTGGVPPVGRPVDDVYAATYRTMAERNRRYYARYPRDRERVRALLPRFDAGRVTLPDGEPVSARRFRQAGSGLGMSDGAENLHYLLELDPDSPLFRHGLADALPFGALHPIYAVLQEACYADGGVTGWSAQRVMPQEFRDDLTMFTGEHVMPWSLSEDRGLAPLADAAELLAHHEWPRLYDEAVLRECDVPSAAAVYADDAYVDRELSMETVAMVPSMRAWLTNEHEHNGLRADVRVLERLIDLARGGVG